ncbi:DEKNAAC102845 [Brettanomyces naardenensis]|uniref:DEKNAAC102845 n=1 Tax=Brettanomyces naardenensis TaxID=13370 RepID=A0A448YLS2_BRENA|nr:DEKNAAC102845 [Brettanomyces naardenensis]
MISLSGASESDDSLSNFCFIRSLLADFDEKFGKFLEDLDTINSQIFSNAAFWGLVDLSSIYDKIVSKPFDGEIFVLKDTEKLESLRVSVLLLSDSLQLYKRLDGKFDSKAIVSEDLTNFRNELSRTLKYGQNCVREEDVEERSVQKHYKPSPEDLDIVSSPQFKQFNARRLQLLGLFDKRIF